MLYLILNILIAVWTSIDGVFATECCEPNGLKCIENCKCSVKNGSSNSELYLAAECQMVDYNVEEILSGISTQVEDFSLLLPTTINIEYGERFQTLNIDKMKRLENLKFFRIIPEEKNLHRPFELRYEWDTFRNMVRLRYLGLHASTWTNNVRNIIDQLTSIEVLNLTSADFGFGGLMKIINGLENKKKLKTLILRNVQSLDVHSMSIEFNLSKLLHPLRNCPLEYLDISQSNVMKLTPGLYEMAPNLRTLVVSENILPGEFNMPFLLEAMMHRSIVTLDVSNQCLISDEIRNSRLNGKSQHEEHPLGFDKHYETLLLSPTKWKSREDNNLTKECVEYFIKQAELSFDLAYMTCNFKDGLCKILRLLFPQYFDNFPCTLLPVVTEIFNPECLFGIEFPLFPHMNSVNLDALEFGPGSLGGLQMTDSDICFSSNSLQKLTFANNKNWIRRLKMREFFSELTIKGLENLQEVDIRHNDIPLNVSHFMKSMPSLKYCYLGGNQALFNENYDICEHNLGLELVDFSLNGITDIPTNAAGSCNHLKHLYYDRNDLTDFKLNLSTTPDIEFVDLRQNKITQLNSETRKNLQETFHLLKNFKIDLTGNPMLCGCSAIEFVKWLQQNQKNLHNYGNYTCLGHDDMIFVSMVNVEELNGKCNPPIDIVPIIASVLSTASVLLITLLVFVIYKKRYHIQYHAFSLRRRLRFMRLGLPDDRPYTYDLYVSYTSHEVDSSWVHLVLMKTLEEKYGFKLCIHHRDFPAGCVIAETIDEMMSDSREILIVVSKNSIDRKWMKHEAENAVQEAGGRKKKIIIVKLGNLPMQIQDRHLATLLRDQTLISWPDDKMGQPLFFQTIVDILYNK